MSVSVGGVARNIAENLGRLDHSVRLLTVAGNDADWQLIEQESAAYMDVTAVGLLPGENDGFLFGGAESRWGTCYCDGKYGCV